MKTLMGYSDKLSVRAGDPIAFKVGDSLQSPYAAQIVRLINGDTNPAGPGYREVEIDGASWQLQGRHQPVRSGSCVIIPGATSLPLGCVRLELMIWPTTPDKPDQVLASLWDPPRRQGMQLVLDGAEGLTLRLGGRSGQETRLALGAPVLARHWYRIEAAFDPATGMATLRQTAFRPEFAVQDSGSVERSVDIAAMGNPGAPLVLAARPAVQTGFDGHFNGKLEAPCLWSGPRADNLFGAWDFSAEMSGAQITDVSGNARHGASGNCPPGP
nr:hypothetical protein [uncultured Lichenicoccus sp.]